MVEVYFRNNQRENNGQWLYSLKLAFDEFLKIFKPNIQRYLKKFTGVLQILFKISKRVALKAFTY